MYCINKERLHLSADCKRGHNVLLSASGNGGITPTLVRYSENIAHLLLSSSGTIEGEAVEEIANISMFVKDGLLYNINLAADVHFNSEDWFDLVEAAGNQF